MSIKSMNLKSEKRLSINKLAARKFAIIYPRLRSKNNVKYYSPSRTDKTPKYQKWKKIFPANSTGAVSINKLLWNIVKASPPHVIPEISKKASSPTTVPGNKETITPPRKFCENVVENETKFINRINTGESFVICAKRQLANGQCQYLIEWN